MEIIKLEKIKNKSPFTHVLTDDIKFKIFPHLEQIPEEEAKELYEELIGSNTALYIMCLAFLVIFEIALFFTINMLELLIVSLIVIILIGFIVMKLINSIQIINNTEIRYSTLSVADVKEAEDASPYYYVKVEDKNSNYSIDEWIEVDKNYNKGDEILLFIISKDNFITMQCKDTGKVRPKAPVTPPTTPVTTPPPEEEEEIL